MSFYQEAREYQLKQEYGAAFQLYRRGMEDQDDPKCTYGVALFYKRGYFVEQDEEKAEQLFKKSFAELSLIAEDDSEAMLLLSFFHINGFATEVSVERYFECTEKSAIAGNVNAQKNLGYAYLMGDKVEKDVAQAVKWYQMASEQGDSAAASLLENNEDIIKYLGKHKRIIVENEPKEEVGIGAIYNAGALIDEGALNRYLERLKDINLMLLELDGLGKSALPESEGAAKSFQGFIEDVIAEAYESEQGSSTEQNLAIAREYLKVIEKINSKIKEDELDKRLSINLIDYTAKDTGTKSFQMYAQAMRNLIRKLYNAESIYAVIKLHTEIGALGSYMKSYVHQMA